MKRCVALLLLGIAPLLAHTRNRTSSGAFRVRGDFEDIHFLINQETIAGLRNADGVELITADSDPVAALKAATEAWNTAGSSPVRFAEMQTSPTQNDPADSTHVITFRDTPEIRSLVGGALAVTLTRFFTSGTIIDSDIMFNPAVSVGGSSLVFSTTGEGGTFDIESIATHELGHALGAGHSGFLGAIMFQAVSRGTRQVLSSDDRAFLREAYPAPGSSASFGRLEGTITLPGGAPARGVLVNAMDRNTGSAVGSLTNDMGAYSIGSVPPGNYTVYAEPLNGPVGPTNVNLTESQVSLDFETTFLPQAVTVAAAASQVANLELAPRRGQVEITFIARGRAGGTGDFYGVPAALPLHEGESVDLIIAGPGFTSAFAAADIELLGPGITMRPGSLRVDPLIAFTDGRSVLRFTVDVGHAPARSLVSLVLRFDGNVCARSGGIIVIPGEPISLTSNSVFNAAQITAGPIAPESWVSIFTPNLARGLVVAPGGTLPGTLGGTTVTLTDFRGNVSNARLQFVSPGQLNFLMPPLEPDLYLLRVVSDLGGGSASLRISRVGPGTFSANASGVGPAAAAFLKIAAGGARTSGFTFDALANPRTNVPVDLGAAGDEVYLTFYGTGIRGAISQVTATIGGVAAPVLAAVAQGEFAGLDQINVGPVPRSLAGMSDQPVVFVVDGLRTNAVTVSFR